MSKTEIAPVTELSRCLNRPPNCWIMRNSFYSVRILEYTSPALAMRRSEQCRKR